MKAKTTKTAGYLTPTTGKPCHADRIFHTSRRGRPACLATSGPESGPQNPLAVQTLSRCPRFPSPHRPATVPAHRLYAVCGGCVVAGVAPCAVCLHERCFKGAAFMFPTSPPQLQRVRSGTAASSKQADGTLRGGGETNKHHAPDAPGS
jgi:hypothetical protein